MLTRRKFLATGVLMVPSIQSSLRTSNPRVRFLGYERVEPLLKTGKLVSPADRTAWPDWIQSHDQEIRSRLLRGEEDTLANFILYGFSFTNQPREAAAARVQDFIAGILMPGNNERLLLLQNLVTRLGYSPATPAERERLAGYLSENIARYIAEQQRYGRTLQSALSNDTRNAFSSTSQLYKDRGLSIDTDFRPNYAIEQALADLKRRGVLSRVRRAAVIGPGLDFADKNSGFDFYPLQTLQPFALIDSLFRFGLAEPSSLRLTVLDISSQTLDHVSRAVRLARGRQPYTIQLVLDKTRSWNQNALDYWRKFGNRVGTGVAPLQAPPQFQNIEQRAVRIRPEVVTQLAPQSLNIVVQHLDLRPEQQFDLIVATNVFVYYDAFGQALSLLNIGSMLSSGGIFLSNDVSQDFPGLKLRAIDNVSVEYSRTEADRVQVYSKAAFTPQLPPI
ncbi:MAG TPA: hypothetical protein VE422_44020 [Terriglobia bacterium]|nr:hypothetical protein [Terriglobia bacterium]